MVPGAVWIPMFRVVGAFDTAFIAASPAAAVAEAEGLIIAWTLVRTQSRVATNAFAIIHKVSDCVLLFSPDNDADSFAAIRLHVHCCTATSLHAAARRYPCVVAAPQAPCPCSCREIAACL